MPTTLILLNPHAGNGGAGDYWARIEPIIRAQIGALIVETTENPRDIPPILNDAYHTHGVRSVIAVGGDGTNHTSINAILALNTQFPDDTVAYGNLPIGTGRDWARGIGLPTDDAAASAAWLVQAMARPTDVGKVTIHERDEVEYFLNIASTGLGGDVVQRVNHQRTRRSWSFLVATVQAILSYRAQIVRVRLDNEDWYEGAAYLVAVANGTTFGRGMKIAPNAHFDDGLFDVVLVKGVSRLTLLTAFLRVYSGTHLTHPAVRHAQAARVDITLTDASSLPIKLEFDGEPYEGRNLTFEVCAGLLRFLR